MLNQKLITALLATWIIFGATSTTLAAVNTFSDVPLGHWAFQSVTALASKGIINGYGNGTFRGDRNITRYEAATMIAKFLKPKGNIINNDTTNDELPFSDVQKNHWAFDSVKTAFGKGIITGYDDKTFRGDKYITRYEMAQMLSNVVKLNLGDKGGNPFSDVQKNHWAKNAVIVLATKGIINGYGDGTFRGNKNITRYEASEMIAKTISARN